MSQLHYYFQSKEGLLVAVLIDALRLHLAALRERLAQVPDQDRIPEALRLVRLKLREEPEWFRLYFDLMGLALWNPRAAEAARAVQQELLSVIRAEARGSRKHSPDGEGVARVVLAALDGLSLQAMLSPGEASLDKAYGVMEQVLDQLAQGFTPQR